jgi:hypothetical protein
MSSSSSTTRGPIETAKASKRTATTGNGKPLTWKETRWTGVAMATPLTKDDVHNAVDGRRYLERHLLLCPAGEPITLSTLTTALHQISATTGIGNHAANSVRAAAFLVEEMEENSISEVVREAGLNQVNELAQDMKSLIDDAKEKISAHALEKANEIAPIAQPSSNLPQPTTSESSPSPPICRPYAEALINPPPHANLKLAAREGIRARQIMLEGIDPTTTIGQMDGAQLKVELNKILGEAGLEGKGIRSAIPQKNKGILIKVESDQALSWIHKKENKFNFCVEVGPDVVFKPRPHIVIAFNAPLTVDPDNKAHIKEICEANHLDSEAIAAIRWVKPIARRNPEQKSAHLFVLFTDPSSANRIIADGLTICNKKIRTEKVKKELTCCLKCQGWNHHAYECIAVNDICGNCAETHWTSKCPHPHQWHCASCKTDDHASWSRNCYVYLKKVSD